MGKLGALLSKSQPCCQRHLRSGTQGSLTARFLPCFCETSLSTTLYPTSCLKHVMGNSPELPKSQAQRDSVQFFERMMFLSIDVCNHKSIRTLLDFLRFLSWFGEYVTMKYT